MPKFLIGWSIEGTTEIEADTAEQAEAEFVKFSQRELAETGELYVHQSAMTQEQIDELCAFPSLKAGSDKDAADTIPF